jgi:hypothetical protein
LLRSIVSAASFLLSLLDAAPSHARPQTTTPGPLRVFLDCAPRDPAQQPTAPDDVDRCDFDYLRTEITYIDYVRDRKQAEVHVLVTTQETASGGTEWTVKFIGLERFVGVDHSLTFTTSQTATDDEERRAFARTFSLGLVRYVAETPLADRVRVTFEAAEQQPAV